MSQTVTSARSLQASPPAIAPALPCAGDRARPLDQPLAPPLLVEVAGASGEPVARFPLFHGRDAGGPDWLGEAFEWLSGAHERATTAHDDAGRIPYRATLPGSFNLDPEQPFAAIAFANLNAMLRRRLGADWPAAPRPPTDAGPRILIATIHDIDFLPLSWGQIWYRLAKNVAIAALLRRAPATVAAILRRAVLDIAQRRRLLDGLDAMHAREREAGIGSTCAFERCGPLYDASVGLSARPGFRPGAAFPYPPYDFREERPFRHLQLPLVLMNVALDRHCRDPAGVQAVAKRIMAAVRAYGWGGVSRLWHDTVLSGCQLSRAVADLYWKPPRNDERWLGGEAPVRLIWPRYSACGLLPPLAAMPVPTP